MKAMTPLGKGGQSTIEYVLMLVVSVSILLALVSQIFQPFNKFLQNYMGSYVQCLLDYGELPALGSDNSQVKDDGDCNSSFESFSIASGRPSKSDQSSSQNASNQNRDTRSERDSKKSNASNSSSPNASNISFQNGKGSVESRVNKNPKVTSLPEGEDGGGAFMKVSKVANNLNNQNSKSTYLTGQMLEDIQKENLKISESKTKVVSNWNQPMKKIPWRKPANANDLPKESEKPFSIWEFLRYLLIIAIIIAIMVFVGGQLLNISRGGEG